MIFWSATTRMRFAQTKSPSFARQQTHARQRTQDHKTVQLVLLKYILRRKHGSLAKHVHSFSEVPQLPDW